MTIRSLACAALLLATWPLPGSGAAGQTAAEPAAGEVAEVLALAREALGWDLVERHPGGVRVESRAHLLATDAARVDVFDGRGRWVQTIDGPLPGSSGSDGETVWSVEWSGTPLVLALGDRSRAEAEAAFLSGAWTGAQELLVFDRVLDGEDLALGFTHADGILGGSVHLDPVTHLPRGVSWKQGSEESTWSFSDFSDHGGLRLPDRVSLEQSGQTQTIDVDSVEFVEALEDSCFAPRLEPPGDTRFAPEVPAALEVKQVPSGHLLVHPTVDGHDLGWFIFDTGAGINCISSSVAERLADGPFGEIFAQGVGGRLKAPFWRAAELQLGPVTVRDPLFLELDLAFLSGPFGVEVGGIIGFELIARCAVEFDMSTPAIALHDPAGYELPAAGRWEQVLLYGRHPNVRASFEGHEGLFKIDTGAAGDWVTMHRGAVAALDLLAGRETRPSSAGGVGGRVSVQVGRAGSFVLGGREFRSIEAQFATGEQSVFGDDYVWGNIGGKLIEPFVVVFDYGHGRIGFVPREEF